MLQLEAAARHPGMVLAAHLYGNVLGHLQPRLVEPALAREHQPGHHQRLGAAARLREPAVDEELVEAAFHALASTVRHEAATGRPRSDHSIPVAGSYAEPDRTTRQGKTPLGPEDKADHGDHFPLDMGA